MKYFYIDSEFNPELLKRAVEFFNSLETADEVTIFIDSEGGDAPVLFSMLKMINAVGHRIRLVVTGQICSAAFLLFYLAQCKREIMPMAFGMHHLPAQKIEIMSNGRGAGKEMEWLIDERKKDMPFIMRFNESIGMSEEDQKKVYDGQDVYFSQAELLNFLSFQEKNQPDKNSSIGVGYSVDDFKPKIPLHPSHSNYPCGKEYHYGCTHPTIRGEDAVSKHNIESPDGVREI